MTHINNQEWLTLPVSVIIAGALIGASIYMGAREISGGGVATASANPAAVANTGIKIAPVTSADHVLGNPAAKVKLIVYTDLECPFCKQYHGNIKTAIAKYSPDDVAVVYRPFPLPFHDKAFKEAEAAECAAEQGGNAKFWAYVDRVFEISPTNNKLDPAELPKIAAHVGLDVTKFNSCLTSGKYKAKIDASIKEGAVAGASGTPYSVLITKDGPTAIKGAATTATLEDKFDTALGKK
ncbi:MAG TPA: thioredoxin domain-containing protein [Candidatus Paceibacterota bacterium]